VASCYSNLALAIQRVTEDIVCRLAATARAITGLDNLCLAGGVALNCVANGKLPDLDKVFIQPASGDAGGALGAALAACHLYGDGTASRDKSHVYLGPSYTEDKVRALARKHPDAVTEYPDTSSLLPAVATALQNGKIVGWFQGRMEFGPRALGNRSILADPRHPDMQRTINLRIKYREGFRPFAPVCTQERADEYLRMPSPYMLLARPLNPALCHPLPPGYAALPMEDKRAVVRSRFPSITHVDMTCRVQTVSPEDNPLFWQLLKAFESLTGEAMLVNTSFNVRGEPVVCTPEEAYHCFMHTGMDLLVIGHHIFVKETKI
jgi:carbamoyltransferase